MEMMSHNQTLEINPFSPIMIKLNELRKVDKDRSALASKQILDNVLMNSAIPFDVQKSSKRNL